MAMNDVALQALLSFQADRARQPLPQEMIGPGIQQALSSFLAMREQSIRDQEAEARLGTPARGTPAAVSVGAPPADPRRRIFGIPFGRSPGIVQIQPPMAGNVGGPTSADIPEEFLTGEVQEALTRGRPVFMRPASRNFRPATVGTDEMRARAGFLPYVNADDPAALLTEPDRAKAFSGASPRVRAGDTTLIPITEEMRARAESLGVDLGERTHLPVSNSAIGGLVNPKPAKSKEGDSIMDEETVLQLYRDEGMTAEEIKKAPRRLKARDYRARRSRLNAKARGSILDLLVGAPAGGSKPTAGDALSQGFGF